MRRKPPGSRWGHLSQAPLHGQRQPHSGRGDGDREVLRAEPEGERRREARERRAGALDGVGLRQPAAAGDVVAGRDAEREAEQRRHRHDGHQQRDQLTFERQVGARHAAEQDAAAAQERHVEGKGHGGRREGPQGARAVK